MSDWEDFCDSNGWSIGSDTDYDTFLDSLEDDPRGAKHTNRLPVKEIASTVGRDELIAALLEGACNNGVYVRVETQVSPAIPCDVALDVFDEWLNAPMPNCFLRIEDKYEVPITFLIDAMRTTGIPLLSDCGDWLAWDAREQRLKSPSPSTEYLWNRARAKKPDSVLDEHEQQLVQLFKRAALSTDHGKKPLLIQREFLHDVMQKREVDFEDPRRIANNDIKNFVLVFYNAAGEIASIPLERAAKLEYPLHTRNCTYMWLDGDLVPLINNAKLLVGAFLIAANHNPNEFQWFLARERGTVFHSAVERIEAPKDPNAPYPSPFYSSSNDSQNKKYVTWEKMSALQIADDITEQSSELGPVYLTIGGHPLDVEFVTTPELYQNALKILSRFGYKINYCLTTGVHINKS